MTFSDDERPDTEPFLLHEDAAPTPRSYLKYWLGALGGALLVAGTFLASRSVENPLNYRSKEVSASATAVDVGTATTYQFPDDLTTYSTAPAGYMKPVHFVNARAQSDVPVWDATRNMFTSKYGVTSAMDTVNTASVEGALMYVQAECINYNSRGDTDKCTRKNGVAYMVFYDIVMVQTNETLAQYGIEYGPMVPMDSGRCTPDHYEADGKTPIFSDPSLMINGDNGKPAIGPFVGGGAKDSDIRAPYPNTWWYSFPNTCPLMTWSTKTAACRASTRKGLCDVDKMPNGVDCTFNYRILGFVPLDDLVGITSMTFEANSSKYANFSQFCNDGQVEFQADNVTGTFIKGIDFWSDPQDSAANAARSQSLVDYYNNVVAGAVSPTQVSTSLTSHFQPLPTPATLTASNPKCYETHLICVKASHGCKRELYGQVCTVCDADAPECVKAPSGFVFPNLPKATVAPPPPPPTTTKPPTTSTEAPLIPDDTSSKKTDTTKTTPTKDASTTKKNSAPRRPWLVAIASVTVLGLLLL